MGNLRRRPGDPGLASQRAMEATVSRLLEAARDTADEFLAAVGTCLCLLGFFGAIYDVLDRLSQ